MMKDGVKVVYRKDAEKADNYNWDRIQGMINPTVAGMDGYIKDAVTSAVLVDAIVTMKMEGKEAKVAKSDVKGKYSLAGIETGLYSYSIIMAGYKTIDGTIEVKVRNVSRMNVGMEVV